MYICVHDYVSTDHFLFSYLSQSHHTALHLASERGHHETVQLLLKQKFDNNRLDKVRMRMCKSGCCLYTSDM